jgi:hypothetical protein
VLALKRARLFPPRPFILSLSKDAGEDEGGVERFEQFERGIIGSIQFEAI